MAPFDKAPGKVCDVQVEAKKPITLDNLASKVRAANAKLEGWGPN